MKTPETQKDLNLEKSLKLSEASELIGRLNNELLEKYPFLIYVTPPKRHELATGNPFEIKSSCV